MGQPASQLLHTHHALSAPSSPIVPLLRMFPLPSAPPLLVTLTFPDHSSLKTAPSYCAPRDPDINTFHFSPVLSTVVVDLIVFPLDLLCLSCSHLCTGDTSSEGEVCVMCSSPAPLGVFLCLSRCPVFPSILLKEQCQGATVLIPWTFQEGGDPRFQRVS